MQKTVERAIKRICREVEEETGCNIIDFLSDAYYNYEYDDEGKKATCDYIIRGLEYEAEKFLDVWHETN